MAKSKGNCSLKRQFAKQNAKNYLLKESIIDQYNNILDQGKLIKAMNVFRNHALTNYGFRADFLTYEDTIGSNKVIFNQSAFRAVDILKGAVTNAVMDIQTQGYVNQARLNLFEPGQAPAFDNSFFEANQLDPDEVNATQGLTRLVTLKERLLSRANERLIKIKPQLRENKDNLPEYNRLLRLQQNLKDYIEGNEAKNIVGLEKEIQALEAMDTRAPELIAPYIEKELSRLDTLVKSTDTGQTAEAKEIIQFIKDMANFNQAYIEQSPVGGHPFYHISELYDDAGNFLLTDAMVQPFKDWAARAEVYGNQLASQEIKIIETVFNNNDKIKNLGLTDSKGKPINAFTYADIMSSGKGLKDITWIDMMVMDVSSGILSHNGLMPQVIRNIVDSEFETQYAWAKEIQEKIDNLTPAVVEELKKMGYSLKGLGLIGVNGVSYDLFRQMIPNSQNQTSGNIVHKYSYKWFEDRAKMDSNFWSAIDEAGKTADDNTKRLRYKVAFDNRNSWFKANTQIINPAMVSSITNDPEFASLSEYFTATPAEVTAHETVLNDLAGVEHATKVIDSQKTKLRAYITQRQNTVDELLAADNVTDQANLSERSKKALEVWEAEHNPFMGVTYRNEVTGAGGFRIGQNVYHSKFEYNDYLPLQGAGYYDENFAQIEANPTLKSFYDVIYDATSGIKQKFPYEIQKNMLATSLPFLEKSIMEILTDKDLTFYQAISAVFRRILDDLKKMFGINVQDELSFAKRNPNTGLPDYQVNDSFITQNLNKINDLFLIKKTNFAGKWGTGRLTRHTVLSLSSMDDNMVQDLTLNHMGKSLTRQELQTEFGSNIPVGKILYRASQHEVAQEKSFDLPKVVKLYTHLAAQYSARQEVLPLTELMKDHYTQIKNQVTNNMSNGILNAIPFSNEKNEDGSWKEHPEPLNRLNGLRVNANKQFDNWFERVVLGNYGLRKHYGTLKGAIDMSPEAQSTFLTKYFSKMIKGQKIDGKIFDVQEKKLLLELDKAIKLLPADDEEAKKLVRIKENLGKDIAASAAVDSTLNFIRFRGLGFNLSSGVTNFIEGQVANSITASSGIYFNPEHIYELSPSDMIAGDVIKQRFPERTPEKVAKAEFLAKAADVLQDNTNDLQKASTKTAFSALKRLNPFYTIAKTEQYNQIPLMVATLKSKPITGINGEISNVWDALEAKYLPDSKQWTVKLNPEFATQENKDSWENYNGESYRNWKSTIRQVIANTHGDFSETGGMMAKSYQAGQLFLMFKTWLPREFYKRYAIEQDDVLAGIKGFKGRYRSHTPVTAAMLGGVAGTFLLGPVGGVVGAGAGMIVGQFTGVKSSMTVLQELGLTSKLLVRKLMGMPVNLVGSVVGKKRLVNTQLSDDYFDKMQSANFTKQDFNNLRGNMQELSMMLMWFGLLLLTKAVAWDDDDEEDSTRRKIHNIFANRFMQLGGQAAMFVNVVELGKTLALPFFKFYEDMGKTISALSKAIEGDDTLMSGANAGESRFINQASKTFLPGIIADPGSAGFGKQTQRQFVPSPFDSYFFGTEKESQRKIKMLKAERRKDLEDEGKEQDEIDDTIKREFPRRGKEQTYEELLMQIEGTPIPDED